jgi:hypothetical protein
VRKLQFTDFNYWISLIMKEAIPNEIAPNTNLTVSKEGTIENNNLELFVLAYIY